MSELDNNYYRPSQDQLEKIVPKVITGVESPKQESEIESERLQGREYIIANQTVEINNLNAKVKELETEISRLRNEMMNLIQAGK